MALVTLPTATTELNFSFLTTLDDEQYYFRFYYQRRTNSWYFDIGESSDSLIITSVRITVNVDLLGQWHHLEVPNLPLVALNILEGQGNVEPNDSNWEKAIKIVYGTLVEDETDDSG